MASSRRDSTEEIARLRQMLDYVITHLRERKPRLDDDRAQLLFEHARETLAGLREEFSAYGGHSLAPGARSRPVARPAPQRTSH